MIENKWGKLVFDGKSHRKGRFCVLPPARCGERCGFVTERKNHRAMFTSMRGHTGSGGDDTCRERGLLIDTQVPRLDDGDKMETEQHVCWHNDTGRFSWHSSVAGRKESSRVSLCSLFRLCISLSAWVCGDSSVDM